MNKEQVISLLRSNSINVPYYLVRAKEELKLDDKELLFLCYLVGKGSSSMFDPELISKDLGLSKEDILTNISNLQDKKFINIDSIKNDKGIIEEFINLDSYYNKLSTILVDKEEEKDSSNIYEIIEKEFGRTLSPIEYEIIKAWLDSGTSEDLIKEALKEATYNGVSNLRYIDKIIYEWGKKGIQTKEDIEKNREAWRKEKSNNKEKNKDKGNEIFEFDWLDEDEQN